MKKITGRVLSIFVACSSLIILILNDILLEFLPAKIQLIIILLGVISAYHTFLTFVMRDLFQIALRETNQQIKQIDKKISILNDCIPYSSLRDIEEQHGLNATSINNEVWIMANYLQEVEPSRIGNDFLNTIYNHIAKHHVKYYYILPDNDISRAQIKSLESGLLEIHKKKRLKITGSICYKYDPNLLYIIPTDYFDIVLYINCDSEGNPHVLKGLNACEGYHCFSQRNNNNQYYYQKIDSDRAITIRNTIKYDNKEFAKINIS